MATFGNAFGTSSSSFGGAFGSGSFGKGGFGNSKTDPITNKTARLTQQGFDPEPQQNLIEKLLNLAPDRSVIENLLELLPRTEAFSANLLGGTLYRGEDLDTAWQKAKGALKGENKLTYTDLLKEAGMGDNFGTKALGFVLGNTLDPSTYLPIGKVLGGAGKIGRKIPGVKHVMGMSDDVIRSAKKAVGIKTFANAAERDADTILKGIQGAVGFETKKNFDKYTPIFEGMLKTSDDQLKLVSKAIEKPKIYVKKLDDAGLALYDGLSRMLEETGETKKTLGIVKELIGGEKVKQLTEKGVKVGKNFMGLGGAEADAYLPHMITDKFKELLVKEGKTPEEMIELLRGMSKRGIAKKEKTRTLLGTIADLNRQSNKAFGTDIFESDLKKIVPRYIANYSRNTSLLDMSNELKALVDDAGKPLIRQMSKKGPSAGMVKLSGLPYEKGFETTPELAQQINRVTGILSSDPALNKFIKGFDKVQNVWKAAVTAPNPTFHINNLIGASFNNYIKDPSSFKPDVLSKLDNLLMSDGKNAHKITLISNTGKKINGAEFMDYLKKHGALTTFITPEKMVNKQSAVGKAVEEVGGGVERLVRTQLAISQWKKSGNLLDAVRSVWEVHGNYAPEAMSSFERDVVKRVIPFYTWAKTNIPFQIKNVINQTGKYSALARLQNQAISPEDRQQLPEWMRSKLLASFNTNPDQTKKANMLNLPMEDLNDINPMRPIESLKQLVGNRMSPFVKAPLELGFNKSLFTDREIVNKNLPFGMQKSNAPELAKILNLIPGVGKAMGYQKYDKQSQATGKTTSKEEINATLAYLMNTLSPVNKFANIPKTAEQQLTAGGMDKTRINYILAAIAGLMNPLSPKIIDPQEQAWNNQKSREAELEEKINYLRQRGLIPKLK